MKRQKHSGGVKLELIKHFVDLQSGFAGRAEVRHVRSRDSPLATPSPAEFSGIRPVCLLSLLYLATCIA